MRERAAARATAQQRGGDALFKNSASEVNDGRPPSARLRSARAGHASWSINGAHAGCAKRCGLKRRRLGLHRGCNTRSRRRPPQLRKRSGAVLRQRTTA